jgi:hypothetical protein
VNPDFVALLREFCAAEARFLVVGAYAVTFHSRPRATGSMGDVECPFIGRDALIRNKRALGRPRDLADLELLGDQG